LLFHVFIDPPVDVTRHDATGFLFFACRIVFCCLSSSLPPDTIIAQLDRGEEYS
jgi:hypothetical protein